MIDRKNNKKRNQGLLVSVSSVLKPTLWLLSILVFGLLMGLNDAFAAILGAVLAYLLILPKSLPKHILTILITFFLLNWMGSGSFIIIVPAVLILRWQLLGLFLSKLGKFLSRRRSSIIKISDAGTWKDFNAELNKSISIFGTRASVIRALCLTTCFFVFFTLLSLLVANLPDSIETIAFILLLIILVSLPIITFAFLLFIITRRKYGRKQKYEVALLVITLASADPDIANMWIKWLALALIVALIQIVTRLVIGKDEKPTFKRIQNVYGFIISIGPVFLGSVLAVGMMAGLLGSELEASVLVVLSYIGLFSYILMRYYLGDCMNDFRIVFFRSFHESSIPLVYGRIVAPACKPFGNIIGLSSVDQRTAEIHKEATALHHGDFDIVENSKWQKWVTDSLCASDVAISDITEVTASVKWEISQAAKILGLDNVILITSAEQKSAKENFEQILTGYDYNRQEQNANVNMIAYSQTKIKNARKQLSTIVNSIWENKDYTKKKVFS